ncbi:MAG: hypothetical protein IKS71_07030 [Bacteroidales bacterium]|nr:hypothetical protein [Bacteroidales bacterium]
MKGSTAAVILLFFAGIALGALIDRALPLPEQIPGPVIEKTDTLWKHDTTKVLVPEPTPVFITLPPLEIPAIESDIVFIHDTVFVPMEQRYYREKEYEAWVSGYRPSLDSIRLFPQVPVITVQKTQPPKRWGIGIQAGYGASKDGLSPYIGIGITWNAFSF